MKTKSVQQVLPPPAPHMVGDGFRVHNFFPNSRLIDKKRMSPFFLLDYRGLVSNGAIVGKSPFEIQNDASEIPGDNTQQNGNF